MFHYSITLAGESIFSNIPKNLLGISKETNSGVFIFEGEKYRNGTVISNDFYIYAITKDKNYVISSRMFNDRISLISQISPELIKNITDDLFHDLVTINTHSIQDMYNILPLDAILEKKMTGKQQIHAISNEIINNIKESATTVLKIIKYNGLTKAAINGVKAALGGYNLKKRNCSIHKTILNVVYLFLPEFNERNIRVEMDSFEKYAPIDVDLFLAGLIPFFENMSKYTLDDSKIYVSMNNMEVNFDMTSIKIDPDEKNVIFDKNYSGKYAKIAGKNGKGLGMYTAKKLFRLNNINIDVEVNTNPENNKINGKKVYEQNKFTVKIN